MRRLRRLSKFPTSPFFSSNCPPLVSAPPTRDLQVPRREPFQPEADALDQTPGCFVFGLNICFQPMKPLAPKSLRQDCAEPFLHITPPVMRFECIVAQVTRAEDAAHNLVDVDNSGKFAVFRTYPIAKVCSCLQAGNIRIKLLRRVGR